MQTIGIYTKQSKITPAHNKSALQKGTQSQDGTVAAQYRRILESIDKLIRYFGKMAETLDTISDDGYQLQKKISHIIEEDTDHVKTENSKIML